MPRSMFHHRSRRCSPCRTKYQRELRSKKADPNWKPGKRGHSHGVKKKKPTRFYMRVNGEWKQVKQKVFDAESTK